MKKVEMEVLRIALILAAMCLCAKAADAVLGMDCSSDSSKCMTVRNAECVSGKCRCAKTFVQDNSECKRVLGIDCSSDSSKCNSVANAACDGTCKCKENFVENRWECIPVLGMFCSSGGSECNVVENAECDSPSAKCVCKETFVQDGGVCKKAPCSADSCKNKGKCNKTSNNGFPCECPKEFGGDTCGECNIENGYANIGIGQQLKCIEAASRPKPVLPLTFAAEVYGSIQRDGSKMFVGAEYFSSELNKGALIYQQQSLHTQIISDYNKDIQMVITDKKICQVTKIDKSKNLSVKELFTKTTQNLAFIGVKTTYGINGDVWNGEFDLPEAKANGSVQAFFADKNWSFPFTFSNAKDWSRPVYLEVIGDSEYMGEAVHKTENTYHFMDVNTYIPPEAFVPPPRVNCPLPGDPSSDQLWLAGGFSAETETYNSDGESGESRIYMNNDAKVIRQDSRSPSMSTYISLITDNNYDLFYIIDQNTKSCLGTSLTKNVNNFPKVNENDLGDIEYVITAGGALFEVNDIKQFTYIGNRACWQGMCEQWSADLDGKYHEVKFKKTLQNVTGREEFVYVPIESDISKWNETTQRYDMVTQQYIFNYNPTYPHWSVFDITSCFDESDKMRFVIEFQGDSKLIANTDEFLRMFQSTVQMFTAIRYTRLHDFRIDGTDDNRLFVSVTLVEDPLNAGFYNNTDGKMLHMTNMEVFTEISERIDYKQFSVLLGAANSANGQDIYFNATGIEKSIISVDSLEEKGSSLVKFTIKPRTKLEFSSQEVVIAGITVDNCAEICDTEISAQCDMFMFCRDSKKCFLSAKHIEDVSDKLVTDQYCDVYSRNYEYDYTLYQGIKLKINKETDSVEENKDFRRCFADCYNRENSTYSCHSVDVCKNAKGSSCVFHALHISQTTRADQEKSTDCVHYSKNYLKMYDVALQRSTVKDPEDFSTITVDGTGEECARKCLSDFGGCTSFDLCTPFAGISVKSDCTIFIPKDPTKTILPMERKNENCDHYTLKGTKTKFNIDVISPTQPPAGTTDAVATSETKVQKSSEDEGKYTGGAMAGLGIAMLIVGGAIGFGAVYFYTRRQAISGNDENFVMRLVKN